MNIKNIVRPCILGILIGLLAIGNHAALAATTILPPAKTCFTDANGPVSAGSVAMYIPSTTTPKATWTDSSQGTQNPNPVVLDNNGCALIFGVGSYRQQLFDANSNLIFDAVTTDTSAYNQTFWAGLAGGTANAITVVDTGFNATDGTVINFTALNTNTGATTINPSSFGAISVVKDTASGPVSLTGGEIVANNIISVTYSSSGNNFHLVNTVISAPSGNTAPLCGATNIKITNDNSTPNSIIDITASSVVMVNPAGQNINRSSVSVTVNTSTGNVTSTAGGMDGESPGNSSWQYIWLIDNGSAPNGLGSRASGNGLSPVMPSGYTYKCRMGAMQTDSSGNLLHSVQLGKDFQYIVGTNPAILKKIASGVAGTYSTTNPTLATATVRGDTFCAPLTASQVVINATTSFGANTAASLEAAPNTNWGGANNGPAGTAGNVWPLWLNAAAGGSEGGQVVMLLEADTIAWAGAGSGSGISCLGYRDQVNAN